MSGKMRLVQSVSQYAGPYYVCDSNVNSELCAPILLPTESQAEREDPCGPVLGIIDAESFQNSFFDEEKCLVILEACFELGKQHLLM